MMGNFLPLVLLLSAAAAAVVSGSNSCSRSDIKLGVMEMIGDHRAGQLPPLKDIPAKYLPQDVQDSLADLSWWLNSNKNYKPPSKNTEVLELNWNLSHRKEKLIFLSVAEI